MIYTRIFSSRIILLIIYCRGHYKNSFSFPAHTSVKVGDQKHAGWYREATQAVLKSLQATFKVISWAPFVQQKPIIVWVPQKAGSEEICELDIYWMVSSGSTPVEEMTETGLGRGKDWAVIVELGLTSGVVPSWVSGPAGLDLCTFSSPPHVPLIFS